MSPWTPAYISITHNIIPDNDTCTQLCSHAQYWRGITAVSSSLCLPLLPSLFGPCLLRPSPPRPYSPPPTHTACRPPILIHHPPIALLIPHHSIPLLHHLVRISPPAHQLVLPPQHAQALCPPCRVLAQRRPRHLGRGLRGLLHVLRPVLCKEGREKTQKARVRYAKRKDKERDANKTESESDNEEDDTTLGFAVFALRNFNAGEEVILGWEWDNGHAVHRLPALLRRPNMFPRVPLEGDPSLLHALSLTFTTYARARDWTSRTSRCTVWAAVQQICLSGTASLHPDSSSIRATRSSPVPTSHTQPNLEPRPPDPPPAPHDKDRMPPKMCKGWMHREIKSRLQWELSQLQAATSPPLGRRIA